MIRAKWLVVAIATSLLLVACKSVPSANLTCDLSPPSSQPPKSDSITVAIHVDGTPSMQGYVTNAKLSRYAQTLDLLDRAFLTGSSRSKSTVQYYRLGTGSQAITREEFRDATLPKFYNGSDPKYPPLPVSKIDTAITPTGNSDKLVVIITDLYQKDADADLIASQIQKNYLNKNRKRYAVGIWGIKSEFNGTVYDVGRTGGKFNYSTQGKQPKQFHPFYVILLGDYSDIVYFYEKIINLNGSKSIESSHFVIFSPSNVVSALSYLQGEPELPPGTNRPLSINNGKVAVEGDEQQKIELLEIDKKESNPLKIDYSVPFAPLKYTLPIAPNSIETDTKVEAFDTDDKKFKEQPDNSPLKKALDLGGWKIADNKTLKIVTNINPSNIQEPGVYFFTVDAVAKGLQEESWWQEWDGSEDNIDGSKTNNLLKFLRNLKTITTDLMNQDSKPAIGRFCYAIQKN